eukprot:858523-Rhodomonas_salina.1
MELPGVPALPLRHHPRRPRREVESSPRFGPSGADAGMREPGTLHSWRAWGRGFLSSPSSSSTSAALPAAHTLCSTTGEPEPADARHGKAVG